MNLTEHDVMDFGLSLASVLPLKEVDALIERSQVRATSFLGDDDDEILLSFTFSLSGRSFFEGNKLNGESLDRLRTQQFHTIYQFQPAIKPAMSNTPQELAQSSERQPESKAPEPEEGLQDVEGKQAKEPALPMPVSPETQLEQKKNTRKRALQSAKWRVSDITSLKSHILMNS